VRAVRFLQMEPTTRCNFTCGFCAGRSMAQGDLAPEVFRRTLESLPDLRHVELQGEGEPLLHPRLFEMARAARDRGAKVSFITNGSLFRAEAVAGILDAGIEKVMVSIESPEAGEFHAIRGGTLEKVTDGIRTLLDARRERGLDRPAVGLAVTVLRGTRRRLPEILALYHRLGLDGGITVQPLQRMASYAGGYGAAMAAEALDEGESADLWFDLIADRPLRRIRRQASASGFYDELMAGWRPGRRRCPWLDVGIYVDRDGVAAPCCMVKDTARHGLGRPGVDPMPEILSRREALRAQLAAGRIPAPCDGCEIARFAVLSLPRLFGLGLRGWRRRRKGEAW
jgi:MoaA/NifB/PqqE/SkfB family radical SAM enzyme